MGGMHLVHANILSPQDLLLILLIALLFFGGKKLPEIGSSLGQAMREFRRTAEEEDQPAPRERPEAAPGGAAPRALGMPAPSSTPAADPPKDEPEVPAPSSAPAAEPPKRAPEAPGTRG